MHDERAAIVRATRPSGVGIRLAAIGYLIDRSPALLPERDRVACVVEADLPDGRGDGALARNVGGVPPPMWRGAPVVSMISTHSPWTMSKVPSPVMVMVCGDAERQQRKGSSEAKKLPTVALLFLSKRVVGSMCEHDPSPRRQREASKPWPMMLRYTLGNPGRTGGSSGRPRTHDGLEGNRGDEPRARFARIRCQRQSRWCFLPAVPHVDH